MCSQIGTSSTSCNLMSDNNFYLFNKTLKVFVLMVILKSEKLYTLFHEFFSTFVLNKISLPERRNKRKSVLEITKMYYFLI